MQGLREFERKGPGKELGGGDSNDNSHLEHLLTMS